MIPKTIKIIGKEIKSRWSVEIDGKVIFLTACDFFLLMALSLVWKKNNEAWLNISFMYGQILTAKYLYRLKSNIERELSHDNILLYENDRKGNYRIVVDELIIDNEAYSFNDGRIKEIIEVLK